MDIKEKIGGNIVKAIILFMLACVAITVFAVDTFKTIVVAMKWKSGK